MENFGPSEPIMNKIISISDPDYVPIPDCKDPDYGQFWS